MTRRWACILGQPVQHSLSPALHNAAFAALGIDAEYLAREVAPHDVAAAVRALREPACLGANVTAPHKQAVVPHLDALSDEARALGAVNTIVHAGGRLLGDNTDAAGLERWLHETGLDVRGQDALVLGAGGAARSATMALARAGAASIRVLNRTRWRAETLVADLEPHVGRGSLTSGLLAEAGQSARTPVAVVVNATSREHDASASLVHPTWYAPGAVAIELAYNPPSTGFMTAALAAGARAENGLGMLIHQAVLAFERWTGRTPPIQVYLDAAQAALPAQRVPALASHGASE